MILFELTGTENNPTYQKLAIANGNRQYDFLKSIVDSSIEIGRPFLSQHVIKALNFQAITCLHTNAGEYRPCPVHVGDYQPPDHYRVPALMDDFVNMVNRMWETQDPVVLASFVLWRLNHIHPFINGNGRTARAACYFVLCLKFGALLPGEKILPELITQNRDQYVIALREVDASLAAGNLDLTALHTLLSELLKIQIDSQEEDENGVEAPAPEPEHPA